MESMQKEGFGISPIPSPSPYTVSNVQVSPQNTLTASLTNAQPNNHIAANLNFEMTFYQDGLAQVVLSQTGEDPRFAISSTGLPVVWEQLVQVQNLASNVTIGASDVTVDLYSSDLKNHWQYQVTYNPFRIYLYVNNVLTTIVNNEDSLRYAALDAPHNTYTDGYDELIEGYEVGIGFVFSSEYVYGLPMRAMSSFPLQQNENYRLFNQDKPYHPYGTLDPLYGNWPYITSHEANMDASAVWMNSSETYVNVEPVTNPITGLPST
jgi:alpha-glucosidase (family GH31 glycosyl hydrolase)